MAVRGGVALRGHDDDGGLLAKPKRKRAWGGPWELGKASAYGGAPGPSSGGASVFTGNSSAIFLLAAAG